ncbi:MAG: DUF3035 domain-containing protein [Alphaproteobacteria bacterium]|nr:DUF3035 domain-containing protein [Alphaproteobacteria bacterium]
MSHRTLPLIALACAAAFALAGCDAAKRSFGLGKQAPDEFQVVSRAPLSVPPDFGLRPPQPGAARPQEEEPRDAAAALLLGGAAGGSGISPSLQTILDQAGTAGADPAIRARINEDNAILAADTSFTDRLIFWRPPPDTSVVVDAATEAQRLAENAATGLPPTAGITPIIEEREKAIFEDLF